MDYSKNTMAEVRSIQEWMKDENTLFIGRRGSTCIGLADKDSDIDYLVVVKNSEELAKQENVMLDTNLVTLDRFLHMLQRLSIETVEALYNLEYVSEEAQDLVTTMKFYVEDGTDSEFLFWYQVWLMLKNQLKQYSKGVNNSKFASKVILYFRLLQDEDLLKYWVKDESVAKEVREEYFRIRSGVITEKDEELIAKVAVERSDSSLREAYRKRSNFILNKVSKESLFCE